MARDIINLIGPEKPFTAVVLAYYDQKNIGPIKNEPDLLRVLKHTAVCSKMEHSENFYSGFHRIMSKR